MFKDIYYRMNEQIAPDDALKRSVAANTNARARRPAARASHVKRAVLAAALLVCLTAAFPALAATDPVNALLYAVSPRAAQYFMPVMKSAEDNGVRMDVLSADIRGENADIYVSLTDLVENRIDETTDLYDSYSIHRPYDGIATCNMASYDPETKTATFLINITEKGAKAKKGDKITFSVGCFLSGKQRAERVAVPLDFADVNLAPATQSVELSGYAGVGAESGMPDSANVLVPGEVICEPFAGFAVSGLGYVDGKLHVQLYIPGKAETDDHASLYLVRGDGTELYCLSLSFRTPDEKNAPYEEYVFDISPEALSDCTLYGDFVKAGRKTEGRWRVTFPLDMAE